MKKDKLSYMQMQEWITTTYLMARARVSRPKRDNPYLGFGRRHLMETLVATLFFSLHLPCRQSYFDLFLPKFQKILTLDIPLRVPLVIHLNLLSSSKILHEFDEGIWLLQLFHGFLPVETFDLWELFILRS